MIEYETNISKIKNGMLFQLKDGDSYYVKIHKHYLRVDIRDPLQFDKINPEEIYMIFKTDGSILFKKKENILTIHREKEEYEQDITKIKDGITFDIDCNLYLKVGSKCIKVYEDKIYEFSKLEAVDRIFTRAGNVLYK